MRGFGYFVLIGGIIGLVAAMLMDVSVSTGMGRVNNLGLMSQQQNFTMVAGVAIIAGLLMVIFGGKTQSHTVDHPARDSRACPTCAETIKNAAIKCRYCGADVEPERAPRLKNGWVASIPCKPGEDYDRVSSIISELGLPVVPMEGSTIGAGPFLTKDEAKQSLSVLHKEHKLFGSIVYRDSVSGKYPALSD